MLKGNRQRRKGRLSPPKLTTSKSEDESSSSNMLLDINDEDLRRYLEICPKEIIKQDADMLNLRKSLVQRNFLYGAQFTSSTPARIVPGVFNKSSAISPILRQRRFEENDASSSSNSTLKTAAHRRSSHPRELVPVETGPDKRGEISHDRWDDSHDSSLSSSESVDAFKRSPRQRHTGGRKSDVRRNSQKLKYTTGRSTSSKQAQDESHDARKKSSKRRRNAVLRTLTTRSSSAESSSSELESRSADVYKRAATQQHSKIASPRKQKSVVAHSTDCERPSETSSESASISKISPVPGSDRRLSTSPSKEKRSQSRFSSPLGRPGSVSVSPVKGRSSRTHARDYCEREKRPADVETDDEFREPVSGRKGRNNARTDDDTSPSKRVRAQAPELEPIPTSNRGIPSRTTGRVTENSVRLSASLVKGRSARTNSQEDERQKRPAEAETDDEFREPVSGRKGRNNARTDGDTPPSKRVRAQAHELEPIPASNRGIPSRTTGRVTENSVVRLSASLVKGRSARTNSQEDERQKRPADVETDDEFSEPVSGRKGRNNARTDDDASPLKLVRAQAPELEPIPASNRRILSRTTGHVTKFSVRLSSSLVKGRSARTNSQEDERQKRPAEAETDDEFREPVSGRKGRNNARTDDDTSPSKRVRAQAPELEPIPTSNRGIPSRTTGRVTENSVRLSASLVKGRSAGTHSQEDERQKRPAEAETDDEFREPVSGQKRRSNARTDDGTSSSKRGRTQASELEAMPGSNLRRSSRCQSKTAETFPGNGVIGLKPHGDAQRGARKHADKTPDEGSKRKENKRLPPSPSSDKNQSRHYTWLFNAYKQNFNTSRDSLISNKSIGELSVNTVNAPNVPTVTEVSCFERNDVDTRSSCADNFTRKANNLNAVIANLVSSSMNGSKGIKRTPRCESVNDEKTTAKAKRRQKTSAKNKAEHMENVKPARKTTNKEKDASKQKRTGTKVQKGGNVVTTNGSTSEEPTGLRRSTRERKQRDVAPPGVVIYLSTSYKAVVRTSKKNTERNKSKARVQSKKVKTVDRGGGRRKRNTVQPSLLGSSGGTSESRDAHAPRLAEENDDSESETESQFSSGADFFKDDAPASSLLIEEERAHRRKTKHLNLRVDNSLFKIEWFGDDTLALNDLESDSSDTTNMRMMHTIGAPAVATSGYIAIGPSVTKPSQFSKKYHLMFYVIKGTAQVCVQDRFNTGGPNCRFFIPFGHEYSISNLSATKKLVLFCVRIPP